MKKISFSKIINNLFIKNQYIKARKLIEKELKKKENANNHWLLCRLSATYYEEKDYKRAFFYIKKARALAPKCPLVLWDYAGTIDMLGREKEAIKIWKALIEIGILDLAYGECGEGVKGAKAIILDCYYRIGLAYGTLKDFPKARYYIKKHIKNRYPGNGSIYSLKEVKSKLKQIS